MLSSYFQQSRNGFKYPLWAYLTLSGHNSQFGQSLKATKKISPHIAVSESQHVLSLCSTLFSQFVLLILESSPILDINIKSTICNNRLPLNHLSLDYTAQYLSTELGLSAYSFINLFLKLFFTLLAIILRNRPLTRAQQTRHIWCSLYKWSSSSHSRHPITSCHVICDAQCFNQSSMPFHTDLLLRLVLPRSWSLLETVLFCHLYFKITAQFCNVTELAQRLVTCPKLPWSVRR